MSYAILGYLIPSAIFLYYILYYEGENLQKKFNKIGNMSGMNKEQIIAKAGNPYSVSISEDGKQQLQWRRNGFYITISFDINDNFINISCEN